MAEKMENRKANYDLLRLMAMLGVIINHVSDYFVVGNGPYLIVTYIWEGLGAFAVPAFMMITGVFALDNPQNTDMVYFYEKTIKKIGIHTVIFSVFYFFWKMIFSCINDGSDAFQAFKDTVSMQLRGWPGHPLWYVYTLMGIHLVIPLLAALKQKYADKFQYHILAIGYCIWALISTFFENVSLSWSIGKVFGYLGFVILGSEINYFVKERNNIKGFILVMFGLVVFVARNIFFYAHINEGGVRLEKLMSLFSMVSIIGVGVIFMGISMISINKKFNCTVKYSFYIYLFHRFVLDVIERLVNYAQLPFVNDCRIYIPVIVVLTLTVSLILSIHYIKLCKIFSKYLTGRCER